MRTSNYKSAQKHTHYQNGQELIWDSGAGFDVVVYQEGSTLFNGRMVACKMKTGIKRGSVIPIQVNQLSEFSLKKWAEMRTKYDKAA